jgi:hypothetical protein
MTMLGVTLRLYTWQLPVKTEDWKLIALKGFEFTIFYPVQNRSIAVFINYKLMTYAIAALYCIYIKKYSNRH